MLDSLVRVSRRGNEVRYNATATFEHTKPSAPNAMSQIFKRTESTQIKIPLYFPSKRYLTARASFFLSEKYQ